MEGHIHRMTDLFAQLGLPSRPDEIRRFIETHRQLPADMALHEAPFWNPAQAGFLRENVQEDADWAEVVDQLSVALRNGR